MFKSLVVILSLAVIFTSGSLRADSIDAESQPAENCRFNYAWTEFPPFMIPSPQKPTGAQIELLEWVAEEMGCGVAFKNMNWKNSISAIKDGSVDVIGRASVTPERNKFARFSSSYRDEVLVLTIRKGESQSLQYVNLEELFERGFRLGVLRGGYFGKELEAIRANLKYQSNFHERAKEADLLLALKNKEIDGFFEEPFIIDNAVMTKSLYSEFEEYPIEMLVGKVHFMFSKQTISEEKVERFNQALNRVKNSEKYKSHWYWSTVYKK